MNKSLLFSAFSCFLNLNLAAQAPTANCAPGSYPLGPTGIAFVPATLFDAGSFSNTANSLNFYLDIVGSSGYSATCADITASPIAVTLIVEDNGNLLTDFCTTSLTVTDIDNPTAICQNITVSLDQFGSVTVTGSQIDNGSTDNCSISNYLINGGTSQTFTSTGNQGTTLTVIDSEGNNATCSATITVLPYMAPFVDTDDSLALLEIYTSIHLSGTSTPALSALSLGAWNPSNPVGSWNYVNVDGSGRVTSVDLSGIRADINSQALDIETGNANPLPSNLFDGNRFRFLQYINLSNCGYNEAPTAAWHNATSSNTTTLYQIRLSDNNFGFLGSAGVAELFTKVAGGFEGLYNFTAENCFFNPTGHNVLFEDVVLPPSHVNYKPIYAWEVHMTNNGLLGEIPDLSIVFPFLTTARFQNNRLAGLATISTIHPTLELLILDNNLFTDANDLAMVLFVCVSTKHFYANNTMSANATSYNFSINGLFVSGLEALLLAGNQLRHDTDGSLNLHRLLNGSPGIMLDLRQNQFEQININPSTQYNVNTLLLSDNNFNQEIPAALFNNLGSGLTELRLNNNQFFGQFPAATNGFYPFNNLSVLDVSNNNLHGNVPLDVMFFWAIPAPPPGNISLINTLNFAGNELDSITDFDYGSVSPSFYDNLAEVHVENNRFDFSDLETLKWGLNLQGNAAAGSWQYFPIAGFPNTPLTYSPQDSIGIGGVRHKEVGSTIVIDEDINLGSMGNRECLWTRENPNMGVGGTQVLGYATAPDASSSLVNFDTSGVVPSVPMSSILASLTSQLSQLSGITQMLHRILDNNAALQIRDAIASYGNMTDEWYYQTRLYNDSFPSLELVSRPKRVIVAPCVDNAGVVIQCQQAFVQFSGNYSVQKTGVILTEEQKQVLRDSIGVKVIKSCPCGDLEMWEISDTTYQNFLLSNGKGTRNVATTTSSSPGLLSANSDYPMSDLPAIPKPAPINTNISGNPNSGNAVRVAIIDSGVDYDHPALEQHIIAPLSHSNDTCALKEIGYNFIDTMLLPYDDHGHGTRVAGVLTGEANTTNTMMPTDGSNNDIAVMSFRYTNAKGEGTLFNTACGLFMAIENGAKVINASWGYWGDECPALHDAIEYAASKDILIVCASGNDGLDNIRDHNGVNKSHWPSVYSNSDRTADSLGYDFHLPNIISVAALSSTSQEQLATNSNYGHDIVHLATDGTVISTDIDITGIVNATAADQGTSFAAPKVARAVALLRAEFPNATICEIKQALIMGVDTLQSADAAKLVSKGRLNFSKARQTLIDSMGLFTACLASATPHIPNTQEVSLLLYPNPFGGHINLQWVDANANLPAHISVFSVDGRLRYQRTSSDLFQSIETHDWQAGFYILQVKRGNKTYSEKIVKY